MRVDMHPLSALHLFFVKTNQREGEKEEGLSTRAQPRLFPLNLESHSFPPSALADYSSNLPYWYLLISIPLGGWRVSKAPGWLSFLWRTHASFANKVFWLYTGIRIRFLSLFQEVRPSKEEGEFFWQGAKTFCTLVWIRNSFYKKHISVRLALRHYHYGRQCHSWPDMIRLHRKIPLKQEKQECTAKTWSETMEQDRSFPSDLGPPLMISSRSSYAMDKESSLGIMIKAHRQVRGLK